MRVLAKIEVSGASLDNIVDAARDEWRRLSGNAAAEIPDGSEISLEAKKDGDSVDYDTYVGVVYIRVNR